MKPSFIGTLHYEIVCY